MCHLDSRPAFRRHLPYLIPASSIRRKIDPVPVSGPAGYALARRFIGQLVRRAALSVHNKNAEVDGRQLFDVELGHGFTQSAV